MLIAQARMTCCEVWLEAFDKRREAMGECGGKGKMTGAFQQILEWVLQASESLLRSRQYASLGAMLDLVDVHLALDDVEWAIRGEGASDDKAVRWAPLVAYANLLLFKAFAAMQMTTKAVNSASLVGAVMQVQRYLECVVGASNQAYCDTACLEAAMRFVYQLCRHEDVETARDVLESLGRVVDRLRETPVGAVDVGHWEMRAALCLMWCGAMPPVSHVPRQDDRRDQIAMVVDGIRMLKDVEDLELVRGFDAAGEATRRLDEMVREMTRDLKVVEAMGMACAAMVRRRRGMRMVLITYARETVSVICPVSNEDGSPAVRMFLLSVLGNLCLHVDAAPTGASPEVCEVIAALVSNRVVLRYLQTDISLVRDLHALLWNVACDLDVRRALGETAAKAELAAKAALLSSALELAELLQDIECIQNAVLQLSRVKAWTGHVDVASELAMRVAEHDPVAATVIKLEIEAARVSLGTWGVLEGIDKGVDVDVATVKTLVRLMFPEERQEGGLPGYSARLSVQEGLHVVCRFLDDGSIPGDARRIISGLLLDGMLRLAVSDERWAQKSADRAGPAGLTLLLFQNLVDLALSTTHPSLKEAVYTWMDDSNPRKASISPSRLARPTKPTDADTVSSILASLGFLANATAEMAVDDLRHDSPEHAQLAAMFAARTLDAVHELGGNGRDTAGRPYAVASQVCWILACYAACLADERDMGIDNINLGTSMDVDHVDEVGWRRRALSKLVSGLHERSVTARADSKTVDALACHAKISELYIHIINGADMRASETLDAIPVEVIGIDSDGSLLLDILGRLPSTMPITLKRALEITIVALLPGEPIYYDAIRTLLSLDSSKHGLESKLGLFDQVHELLSTSASTPPFSFVEWFYLHAYNAGQRDIALEGIDRHALLSPAQRALLRKTPATKASRQ